jgi:hypothetical protein
VGGSEIRSEIYKLINSIWNKEELPEQWKQSITVHIYKQGDKTDCSDYRVILRLSTTYKMLSNILLSKLTQYADEITGDNLYEFRGNRTTRKLQVTIFKAVYSVHCYEEI